MGCTDITDVDDDYDYYCYYYCCIFICYCCFRILEDTDAKFLMLNMIPQL